ncbi:hypothetical protein BC831DRAFT_480429, partial [Entophlyctis helioformis]
MWRSPLPACHQSVGRSWICMAAFAASVCRVNCLLFPYKQQGALGQTSYLRHVFAKDDS